MKLKSLAIAVILLSLSAFAGTFTSTAGRFSADFVATPTQDVRTIKTAKGTSVDIANFFAHNEDKTMGENIDYVDFPQPLTEQELLDTARAAFDDMTLDGVGKTEVGGRTWLLAAGRGESLLYFYASTCVGNRLYEVTIAEPIKGATKEIEAAAEKFLGSVKITE